jgi:hypothetical protein
MNVPSRLLDALVSIGGFGSVVARQTWSMDDGYGPRASRLVSLSSCTVVSSLLKRYGGLTRGKATVKHGSGDLEWSQKGATWRIFLDSKQEVVWDEILHETTERFGVLGGDNMSCGGLNPELDMAEKK